MKSGNVILAISLICSAGCWAQAGSGTSSSSTQAINAQNANNLCRIYFVRPKPGSETQGPSGTQKRWRSRRKIRRAMGCWSFSRRRT